MQMETNERGCYAEHLFFLKCMELGFIVSKPILDSCVYDCIVDNGKRLFKVQVKTRNLFDTNRKNKLLNYGKKKYKLTDFEYYAIYLYETEDWLIVKNEGQTSMRITQERKDFFNNFALLF